LRPRREERDTGVNTLSKETSKFGWKQILVFVLMAVTGTAFLPGCSLHSRRHADLAASVNAGDQPDKMLFEKATNEITHGRYDIGRLTLQTLINTYPDSEFLAKAKLAIANSYFTQGGTSGLTQAEAEYKDFITFFPTAPEAPEAQFRIGMSHFHLMAKADRDPTEARLAEVELKEFLVRYPSSPLTIRVKARLRETQEVLAMGEYETASFYLARGAYRAARGRFRDVVEKYPNFSGGDDALYGLGQSLEHLRIPKEAVPYYSRLISDFPLSEHVPEATARLVSMKQPVPVPTKATLARARADTVRLREKSGIQKMMALMSSTPDTSTTLRGPVHLQPNLVEAAKAELPPPPPPANAIVAEPESDTSVDSETPAETAAGEEAAGSESGSKTQEASGKTTAKGGGSGNDSSIFKVSDKQGRLGAALTKVVRKDKGAKSGEQPGMSSTEEKESRLGNLKKKIITKDDNYGGETKKASPAGEKKEAKAKGARAGTGKQSAVSAPEKKKGRLHIVKKMVGKGKDSKAQKNDQSSTGKETDAKPKETDKGSGNP